MSPGGAVRCPQTLPDVKASRWTLVIVSAAGPLASGSQSRRDVWNASTEEEPPSAALGRQTGTSDTEEETDSRVASGAVWHPTLC